MAGRTPSASARRPRRRWRIVVHHRRRRRRRVAGVGAERKRRIGGRRGGGRRRHGAGDARGDGARSRRRGGLRIHARRRRQRVRRGRGYGLRRGRGLRLVRPDLNGAHPLGLAQRARRDDRARRRRAGQHGARHRRAGQFLGIDRLLLAHHHLLVLAAVAEAVVAELVGGRRVGLRRRRRDLARLAAGPDHRRRRDRAATAEHAAVTERCGGAEHGKAEHGRDRHQALTAVAARGVVVELVAMRRRHRTAVRLVRIERLRERQPIAIRRIAGRIEAGMIGMKSVLRRPVARIGKVLAVVGPIRRGIGMRRGRRTWPVGARIVAVARSAVSVEARLGDVTRRRIGGVVRRRLAAVAITLIAGRRRRLAAVLRRRIAAERGVARRRRARRFGERLALADQPRQFGKRIACGARLLGPTARWIARSVTRVVIVRHYFRFRYISAACSASPVSGQRPDLSELPHLSRRSNPQHRQPRGENGDDALYQSKARHGQLWIILDNEA